MAEGARVVEPHRHVVRRTGGIISKHLNLADEALVERLIANGCINEKDRDKYTGQSKLVKKRFISRFDSQPYEVFLRFLECLRGDEKYSELFTILQGALTEHGYVPPSDVTASHDTSSAPTLRETTEDVDTESASSIDIPGSSPSIVMEDVEASTMTKGSKHKLQRQPAVTEDKGLSTPSLPDHIKNIDDVAEVMSELSIATRGGDYPRLPFEGDRETMTFTSEGGELFSFTHKFRIVVPPNAVPPGNHATLHVTGYCHGPFQLPTGSKPCSDFIFVEMDGIDSFQLPATVEISHNLVMENYTSCCEVSICRCECDGSFITASPSHQYPIVFKKITEPNVSNTDNVFSFELKTFCGLCAVYDESASFPYLRQKATNSTDRHSLQQSHSGETPLCHNESASVSVNRFPSINSQSSCDSVASIDSSFPGGSRKRKLEDSCSAGSQEKQTCRPQYLLLCYWPLVLTTEAVHSAVVFVCKNCPTSIAACKNQIAIMSFHKLDPTKSVKKYLEFNFDESRKVVVDVEVTTADMAGWDLCMGAVEVHENDVLEMWGDDDQTRWLSYKVQELQYPPRMILDVYCDVKMAMSTLFKFTVHLGGIQETVYSRTSDKTCNLVAKSDWYSNYSMITSLPGDNRNISFVKFDFSPYSITTRLLVQVAMELVDFPLVARYLGFNTLQVARIQTEYSTYHERCYQMLLKWISHSTKQSPATLEELHVALYCTDQGACLPGVLERNDKYGNVELLSQETGISLETLNSGIASNKLMWSVAIELCATWQHVGRLLDLKETEIDEIYHDYVGSVERAYRMLRKWREKKGSAAKLSQLAIALLIVDHSSTLCLLCQNTQCSHTLSS